MSTSRSGALWRFLRDPIALLVAGVALAYLGTNGVMLWVALRAPSELVSADYYARSKRVNERQALAQSSAASGWRITADSAAATRERFVFQVTGAAGAPVSGLAGIARAYRPSEAALDQALDLLPHPSRPGVYEARFAAPRPGLWEIELELTGPSSSVRDRIRHVSP